MKALVPATVWDSILHGLPNLGVFARPEFLAATIAFGMVLAVLAVRWFWAIVK